MRWQLGESDSAVSEQPVGCHRNLPRPLEWLFFLAFEVMLQSRELTPEVKMEARSMTSPQDSNMIGSPPFSIRIFIVDGNPDGLRIAERSNWNGKAMMFPRAIYTAVKVREEFQHAGVYLLFGPRTDADGEILYIGEGDPVGQRIADHYAKKDFWTRALLFVASTGALNKAHVQYLESLLVAKAHAAKRVKMDNLTKPGQPTLSEADRADMNVFLSNILGMLPVLGVNAFETSSANVPVTDASILHCTGRGASSRGRDTAQGFVVLADSVAVATEVPSLQKHFPNVSQLRSDLLANGVVTLDAGTLRFTQDYTFNSPSLASSFVMGSSSNGRVDWRDSSGRTLKEIQESENADALNEVAE